MNENLYDAIKNLPLYLQGKKNDLYNLSLDMYAWKYPEILQVLTDFNRQGKEIWGIDMFYYDKQNNELKFDVPLSIKGHSLNEMIMKIETHEKLVQNTLYGIDVEFTESSTTTEHFTISIQHSSLDIIILQVEIIGRANTYLSYGNISKDSFRDFCDKISKNASEFCVLQLDCFSLGIRVRAHKELGKFNVDFVIDEGTNNIITFLYVVDILRFDNFIDTMLFDRNFNTNLKSSVFNVSNFGDDIDFITIKQDIIKEYTEEKQIKFRREHYGKD